MADIKRILDKQRKYFSSGETAQVSFRIGKLEVLRKHILECEEDIICALKKDLGKALFEAYETEIGAILEELKYTMKHLRSWARPRRVRTPVKHFISSSYIVQEPYGIALIMSPWNYPFQLTLSPLIGAIAAGNCAVVKPSAYSPATSSVIAKIIGECFNEEYIAVIEGGREANNALLDGKFDYIFFTGSVAVGKTVMAAAAVNLTPVTLELGGKSPCIVARDANLELAARRIVWGKFLNAGQTCVAPDYLMVHSDVKEELLENMKKCIKEFYGDLPCKNEDLARIINEKHFKRLSAFLKCGEIVTGGETHKDELRISPTIIDHITWEDPLMKEEIFGPILPVLEFKELSEVISTVSSHPKPLALYLFTTSRVVEKRIVDSISFGGGCINDTMVHLATPLMPFGGVGDSGMGGYHGKSSFDTFTHQKSILKKSNLVDIKLRYPPYGNKIEMLKRILK